MLAHRNSNTERPCLSMSERMPASLVCDALCTVLLQRKMPRGVIMHTDRDSQYCSHEHRALLDEHGLIASMSARGNGHDNAAMESWSHTRRFTANTSPRASRRVPAYSTTSSSTTIEPGSTRPWAASARSNPG